MSLNVYVLMQQVLKLLKKIYINVNVCLTRLIGLIL